MTFKELAVTDSFENTTGVPCLFEKTGVTQALCVGAGKGAGCPFKAGTIYVFGQDDLVNPRTDMISDAAFTKYVAANRQQVIDLTAAICADLFSAKSPNLVATPGLPTEPSVRFENMPFIVTAERTLPDNEGGHIRWMITVPEVKSRTHKGTNNVIAEMSFTNVGSGKTPLETAQVIARLIAMNFIANWGDFHEAAKTAKKVA